jgi:hypothetical protein
MMTGAAQNQCRSAFEIIAKFFVVGVAHSEFRGTLDRLAGGDGRDCRQMRRQRPSHERRSDHAGLRL